MNIYTMEQKEKLLTAVKFSAIALTGILLRFFIMTLGHNFDFDSYQIVGKIVSSGGNVYAETTRYNYGPVFSLILGLLYYCASFFRDHVFAFRIFIVGMLTAADCALAFLVYKKYGSLNAAALFLLNPVSVIITGYHNQFDALAILPGYAACLLTDATGKSLTKKDIVPIALVSLSLMTKHLLFLFPVWMLFKASMSGKKRVAYAFVPPALFLLSFLPYIDKGLNGILHNVFLYRPFDNFPLLHMVFRRLNICNLEIYFFVASLAMLGYWTRQRQLKDQILFYFIGLVCFSPAVANQYLAIPVLAICILGGFFKHVYFAVIGLFLTFSPDELKLGIYYNHNSLVSWLVGKGGYMTAAWILFAVLLYRLWIRRQRNRSLAHG